MLGAIGGWQLDTMPTLSYTPDPVPCKGTASVAGSGFASAWTRLWLGSGLVAGPFKPARGGSFRQGFTAPAVTTQTTMTLRAEQAKTKGGPWTTVASKAVVLMACTETQPTPIPGPTPTPAPPVIGTCNVTVASGGNIQAAINAAPDGTSTSPTVICLAAGGTYTISSTILIANRNYLVIDGNGATIQTNLASGSVFSGTQELIIVRSGRGHRFSDFTLRGSHNNPGTYVLDGREFQAGITMSGANSILIEGVNTRDNFGDGFGVDAWAGAGTHNVVIRDCTVQGNGRMGVAVVNGSSVLIDNVDMTNWAWAGLDIEPDAGGPGVTDVTMQNCTFAGSGLLMFAQNIVGGNRNITVQNNRVLAGANRGIWSTVSEPKDGRRNSNVNFLNNVGEQAFWEDPTGPGSGWPARGVLLVKDADNVTISGNTQPVLAGFGMYGIVNNNSTGITQSGNSFPNSSGNYGL